MKTPNAVTTATEAKHTSGPRRVVETSAGDVLLWVEVRPGTYQLDAEHGLWDAKGRGVGGHARILHTPGCFAVSIFATRNGQTYGAIPRSTEYTTLDEAMSAGERGLEAQRKRYTKKYGAALALARARGE